MLEPVSLAIWAFLELFQVATAHPTTPNRPPEPAAQEQSLSSPTAASEVTTAAEAEAPAHP